MGKGIGNKEKSLSGIESGLASHSPFATVLISAAAAAPHYCSKGSWLCRRVFMRQILLCVLKEFLIFLKEKHFIFLKQEGS